MKYIKLYRWNCIIIYLFLFFGCQPSFKSEFSKQTLKTLPDTIRYSKEYNGHLQGMTTDFENSLFWSHTTQLVKTDLAGTVLKVVDVPTHHGDLEYYNGKVYVAVNLGKFNEEPGLADSWIYVYEPEELALIGKYSVPEVVHGAGGIAIHNNRVMIVGGLPGNGKYEKNFVYEYDLNLKFKKRHDLAGGYTYKGIQTATYFHGNWYFTCYGNKEKKLKPRVLKVRSTNKGDLEFIQSLDLDLSHGMIGLDENEILYSNRNMDAMALKMN